MCHGTWNCKTSTTLLLLLLVCAMISLLPGRIVSSQRRTLVSLLSLHHNNHRFPGSGYPVEGHQSCRHPTRSMTTRAASSDNNHVGANSGAGPTMETESYHDHSIHQYDAHVKCQHLLEAAIQRWAKRIALEDFAADIEPRRRHIVDLGSADGANSMRTLQWTVWTLQQAMSQQQEPIPLEVTFEEHPASDHQFLQSTLAAHDDWFGDNNIVYSILMKSFYEPLFDPESVDLLVCYICLHWLDTTDQGADGNGVQAVESRATTQQQTLGDDQTTTEASWKPSDFVFMNEATAPAMLQKQYAQLAKRHLAKFLALRARELRPGAEMILMMVSQPNDYVCPLAAVDAKNRQPAPAKSVLTMAMQRCVQQGLLREQVLERTLIPYYLRTKQDVRDALEMASTINVPSADGGSSSSNTDNELPTTRPGALLALVGDVETYSVRIGGQVQDSTSIQGASDMFWSIHAGAVQGAGATEMELEAVRREVEQVFHEVFLPQVGVNITFLACVVRRKTREAWPSAGRS